MERPNTISGLQAKRSELARLHKQLIAEARQIETHIEQVEAVIHLFDPDASLEHLNIRRYAPKNQASRGAMKRFVLDCFREAGAPLTTAEIADRWIASQGFTDDDKTRSAMRKRIGGTIKSVRDDGLVECVGVDGLRKRWVLKRGDL